MIHRTWKPHIWEFKVIEIPVASAEEFAAMLPELPIGLYMATCGEYNAGFIDLDRMYQTNIVTGKFVGRTRAVDRYEHGDVVGLEQWVWDELLFQVRNYAIAPVFMRGAIYINPNIHDDTQTRMVIWSLYHPSEEAAIMFGIGVASA